MHKKPIEVRSPSPRSSNTARKRTHNSRRLWLCPPLALGPKSRSPRRASDPLRKLMWNLPDRRDQKRSFSPPVIGSSGESRPAVKDMSPLGSTGLSVSIAGNGAIAVLPVPTGGAYGFENLMPPRLPLLEAELATVATFA
jgi:hypothetical protein